MRLKAALLLLPLLASGCGGTIWEDEGRGRPQPRLSYVDPAGPGWRFLRDPEASTPTHLVLDLVPPDTEPGGRGVILDLNLGLADLAWAKVAPADPEFARNGQVYDLGTGVQVLLGRVRGADLRVAVLQKGPGNAAAYDGRGVLSIALDLDPASGWQRAKVPFAVAEAYHLPPAGAKVSIGTQVLVGDLVVETVSGAGAGGGGGSRGPVPVP